MRDPIVFDDGVRLTENVSVRVPRDLHERMKAAAAVEGVAPAEFARRAIAERALRITEPGGTPVPTTAETAGTSHG